MSSLPRLITRAKPLSLRVKYPMPQLRRPTSGGVRNTRHVTQAANNLSAHKSQPHVSRFVRRQELARRRLNFSDGYGLDLEVLWGCAVQRPLDHALQNVIIALGILAPFKFKLVAEAL